MSDLWHWAPTVIALLGFAGFIGTIKLVIGDLRDEVPKLREAVHAIQSDLSAITVELHTNTTETMTLRKQVQELLTRRWSRG